MKRIYLATATMSILFYSSCYEKDPIRYGPPVYDQVMVGGQFANGSKIATVNITDSNSNAVNISVSLITNDANDEVSCSITGLPAGIRAHFDSSARPLPLNIQGSIVANCDTGIYNAMLNVNSKNLGLKHYPIKFNVQPVPDGATGLTGTYAGSDPCGHFSIGDVWYTYTATVTTVPGHPHWIAIKNYRGLGDSITVIASVICTDQFSYWVGSVNIPLQTVHGYTIFGNGKGSYGVQENEKPFISIFGDTIIHAGDTQTCYTQLNM